MSKATREQKELTQALADQEYWHKIGKRLGGLKLRGWTYRQRATFGSPGDGHSIQIESWLAQILIDKNVRGRTDKSEFTELHHVGTYKDGGSKRFIDRKTGSVYWQCFKIGSEDNGLHGKLFCGNINDSHLNPAVGKFILIEMYDGRACKTEIHQ